VLSQDAAHLLPSEEDEESITLDPEERKAVRNRLERATRLEKENRELRERYQRLEEQKRRLEQELRRVKASAPFLAASDLTAEAGGVPSGRVIYRRPVRPREPRPTGGQPGHEGRSRERPVPNSPPLRLSLDRCTGCGGRLGVSVPPADWPQSAPLTVGADGRLVTPNGGCATYPFTRGCPSLGTNVPAVSNRSKGWFPSNCGR
jgi:hypothetical protein